MSSSNTDKIVNQLKDDFESLAQNLLGEPNRALSSAHNWRYGSKGSLSIEIGHGSKRGLWKSHDDDAGGGPIQLIQHVRKCSVVEAFAFAKHFLGDEGTRPAPRPRQAPPPKPKLEPEASRTDHAMAMWSGARPLAGTIAARYLVEFRGVPAKSISDLEPVARYHPAYRASPDARISHPALIVLATDSSDSSCGIQAVRLQANGRKFAGSFPKISNGILTGAAVRLPGIGELIIAEGIEKGIVAWAATGRPVWVSLGSLIKVTLQVPDGTSVTLSRDQDRPDSPAAKAFDATCNALVARGCRVSVACPPVADDGAKVDWDDLSRSDGIAAVSECIAAATVWGTPATKADPLAATPAPPPQPLVPTYSDADHVSLKEGERLLSEFGARFVAKVRGWHDWAGEKIKPERVTLPGIDLNIETPEPAAPCELLNATLGLGKTALICDVCADVPQNENCNVYAKDHSLVFELAERIKARLGNSHRVIPFYGREQNHPDGEPMCHQAEMAKSIAGCNQSVRDKLCKFEVSPGCFEHCTRHPEVTNRPCRYEQQCQDKEPAIRVAPHAYLAIGKGNPLPKAALHLIDENPSPSLIRDGDSYGVPLRMIQETKWISQPRPCKNQTKQGQRDSQVNNEQSAKDYSKWLHAVLSSDKPTPAKLREAGLDAGRAKWMAGEWYRSVEKLEITPSMPHDTKKTKIIAYKSQLALKMGKLWTLVHDVIDLDIDELRCFRVREEMKEHPETMIYMVWSVDPKIEGPTLICDGTADEEIMRRFFPTVEVTTINVRAENYDAIQVIDRAVSKNMLGYGLGDMLENPRDDEVDRARRNRKRLALIAEVEQSRSGGPVPLMTYKPVAEAMRAECPNLAEIGVEVGFMRADGKFAGHHGAERGTDRYRDAPAGIIGGRNLPPREALERQARAIFYKDARPMTYQGPGRYDKAERVIRTSDGMGCAVMNETHPDQLVRRCLDQAVRVIAEQEAHRLRLIRRTAENAPRLIIETNICLNLTIHKTTTWDELVPNFAEVMLARGVVPADWIGRSMVVGDMFDADVGDPALALRVDASRNPTGWKALEFVTDPYSNSYIGKCNKLAPYRYRRQGQRQGATVWIADHHKCPALAALAWFGPLAEFAEVTQKTTAATAPADVHLVAELVETPIAAPVETPIAAPVETPIAAPVAELVETPIAAPVAELVETPIAAPVTRRVSVGGSTTDTIGCELLYGKGRQPTAKEAYEQAATIGMYLNDYSVGWSKRVMLLMADLGIEHNIASDAVNKFWGIFQKPPILLEYPAETSTIEPTDGVMP